MATIDMGVERRTPSRHAAPLGSCSGSRGEPLSDLRPTFRTKRARHPSRLQIAFGRLSCYLDKLRLVSQWTRLTRRLDAPRVINLTL